MVLTHHRGIAKAVRRDEFGGCRISIQKPGLDERFGLLA
jgi:hypothetical protein